MSKRSRRVTIAAGVVLLVGFISWSPLDTYQGEYRWGPVQVIGCESELWIFYERERRFLRIHWPTPITGRAFRRGASALELLVLNRDGVVRRVPISKGSSVGFGPESSRVFVLSGRVFLFFRDRWDPVRQLYGRASILQWQDDHFGLVPSEEAEGLLQGHGLDPRHLAAGPLSELDVLTEKGGWHHLYADRLWRVAEVSWNELSLRLEQTDVEDHVVLKICAEEPTDWKDVKLLYDKERTELNHWEYQKLELPPLERCYQ